LRAFHTLDILHVGRHGEEDGPSAAYHRLVHEATTRPRPGERASIAVPRRRITLESHRKTQRQQLLERVTGVATRLPLGELRAVDPDETDLSAVGAVESVAVHDASDPAVALSEREREEEE